MLPNYQWKHVVASEMSPEVYHKNQDQNPTLHNILSKEKWGTTRLEAKQRRNVSVLSWVINS